VDLKRRLQLSKCIPPRCVSQGIHLRVIGNVTLVLALFSTQLQCIMYRDIVEGALFTTTLTSLQNHKLSFVILFNALGDGPVV
jgi:hypothetical protein